MTNKELRYLIQRIKENKYLTRDETNYIVKALEVEPLTDTEQRIFLAAMSKEEKVCKEVCADGEGVDLVAVCHRVERKVKKALWG